MIEEMKLSNLAEAQLLIIEDYNIPHLNLNNSNEKCI